jgi:hypothetical protein
MQAADDQSLLRDELCFLHGEFPHGATRIIAVEVDTVWVGTVFVKYHDTF